MRRNNNKDSSRSRALLNFRETDFDFGRLRPQYFRNLGLYALSHRAASLWRLWVGGAILVRAIIVGGAIRICSG